MIHFVKFVDINFLSENIDNIEFVAHPVEGYSAGGDRAWYGDGRLPAAGGRVILGHLQGVHLSWEKATEILLNGNRKISRVITQ